jgi:hypothetical protein
VAQILEIAFVIAFAEPVRVRSIKRSICASNHKLQSLFLRRLQVHQHIV